jgi:hypothetical protein
VSTKRNIIAGLLLFVALWAVAHRALVVRHGVDPWKLGAFAMYATANLPVLVAAVGTSPQKGTTVIDETTLPPWVRDRLDRFHLERGALGTLRDPADVGQLLLATRPDLTAVTILIQRSTLDPATARIDVATPRYVYQRDRPGS